MRLIASVLYRPGENQRYQPRLLEHLLTYVDAVRILFDGPPNAEADMLSQLDTAGRVLVLADGPLWAKYGEGYARQALLDWTLEGAPSHIISLDADEICPDGQHLRRAIRRHPEADAFSLRMVEVWDRSTIPWRIRVDGGWRPHWTPCLWKVPRRLTNAYQIRQVPLACGRVPEAVDMIAAMGEARPLPHDIVHLGWSDPQERQARYERYMQIDGGRHHDRQHLESIMQPPELLGYAGYPDLITPADAAGTEDPPQPSASAPLSR